MNKSWNRIPMLSVSDVGESNNADISDYRLRKFIFSSVFTEPVYVKKLKFIFSAIHKFAALRYKSLEDLRILEVACGRGGITFPLASLGCKVRAFDIDEMCVRDVQARIDREKVENLTVMVGNACTFEDGQIYDVVVASEIFEHVLEPLRLAENIKKRMVDGSDLIVTIPNGYGPWELINRINPLSYLRKWNLLRHLLGKSPYVKGDSWGHVQFYTRNRLTKLFSALDFKLVDFAKADSLLAMFSPLKKSPLFGNLDISLADYLPYWLASGWYFVFELQNNN